MSSIFVSVGQCGNQLASSLLDHLLASESARGEFLYNYYDSKFRFVCMDSESKVINGLVNNHGSSLRRENLLNTKSGRGSNWACGYRGLGDKDDNKRFLEQSLEAIRGEAERCDFLLNFNILHSLSGGTGSGCGSMIVEKIRDEYGSKKYMQTQSIAPFSQGEMPLQHYNNLLCLSYLQEFVDSIGLHQNDDIFNIIERNSSENSRLVPTSKTGLALQSSSARKPADKTSLATISFEDINAYISRGFLNTFLPVDGVSMKQGCIGMELLEFQRLVCPINQLKIVEFYNVAKSESKTAPSSSGQTLLRSFLSSLPKYNTDNSNHYTTIQSLIISRGFFESGSKFLVEEVSKELDSIKKALNPVKWNPFPIDLWHSKKGYSYNQQSTTKSAATSQTNLSISIAANRNKCVDYLSGVLTRSEEKYNARAYLHWYEKYEIGSEQFEFAFESLKRVINAYNEFSQ